MLTPLGAERERAAERPPLHTRAKYVEGVGVRAPPDVIQNKQHGQIGKCFLECPLPFMLREERSVAPQVPMHAPASREIPAQPGNEGRWRVERLGACDSARIGYARRAPRRLRSPGGGNLKSRPKPATVVGRPSPIRIAVIFDRDTIVVLATQRCRIRVGGCAGRRPLRPPTAEPLHSKRGCQTGRGKPRETFLAFPV
jgi:hypothetical protein